jgi:Uma2 family endonuclease
MGDAAERIRMTEEEYLAFERASDERHEYSNGFVIMKPASCHTHSLVVVGIGGELHGALRGKKCQVFSCSMRVYIPSSRWYVYPDCSVVCGRPELKDLERDNLLNPRVVVEVLSAETEAYDRGDKFAQYQTLPSVMHYVLAAQDKQRIEVFTRLNDGSWNLRTYGPGDRIALSAIEGTIEVDQVYTNVFDTDYDDAPAA